MELKLNEVTNYDLEELQRLVKAVTGKHKSKRQLVLILVDAGIESYNTGEACISGSRCLEGDTVICSVSFPDELSDEIGRIKSEAQKFWSEEAVEAPDEPAVVVNTHDIVNFLCRSGYQSTAAPYVAILEQNKKVEVL